MNFGIINGGMIRSICDLLLDPFMGGPSFVQQSAQKDFDLMAIDQLIAANVGLLPEIERWKVEEALDSTSSAMELIPIANSEAFRPTAEDWEAAAKEESEVEGAGAGGGPTMMRLQVFDRMRYVLELEHCRRQRSGMIELLGNPEVHAPSRPANCLETCSEPFGRLLEQLVEFLKTVYPAILDPFAKALSMPEVNAAAVFDAVFDAGAEIFATAERSDVTEAERLWLYYRSSSILRSFDPSTLPLLPT